jgi:hypothetical protein
MAFKNRKETIENQIREHNLAKQMSKQSNPAKCPISHNSNQAEDTQEKTSASISNTDLSKSDAMNSSQNFVELNINKKVVVSIQTNEEKQKENNLSRNLIIGILICTRNYFK